MQKMYTSKARAGARALTVKILSETVKIKITIKIQKHVVFKTDIIYLKLYTLKNFRFPKTRELWDYSLLSIHKCQEFHLHINLKAR